MFVTTANAQIMYNKVKPVSLESQSFKQIQDLPIIDFPVEENGSMMQSNLNLIVKNKAIFESANDKNIARMMIKVNAQSLGNITVSFKDVLLDNNSYCLVYTQDHQIVAGPIYQKSINNNKFTIMNIPASELILEVIYKDKNDFTLKLDEVSFSSLVNLKEIKKKKQNQLLNGSCDDFGVKSFTDNVLNINFLSYTVDIPNGKLPCDSNNTTNNYNLNMGCEWMAANNLTMNDLKTFSKFNSVNGIGYTDFKASRSTCNFMIKSGQCELDSVFPANLRYATHNATLINLPSSSCTDSYIICSAHTLGAFGLDSMFNSQNARENSIVRFNYHYKYGSPEHLYNVTCAANPGNFNLWRSTIDFSEVIDYQGVEVFSYDATDKNDFIILKLNCKPFYKEHHLGWTMQTKFDTQYNYNKNNNLHSLYEDEVKLNYKPFAENTFIIGSRGGFTPKLILNNYFTFSNKYVIADNPEILAHPQYSYFSYSGYSGSCIFYKNYLNSGNEIAYSLVQVSAGLTAFGIKGNFNNMFKDTITIPPTGNLSISNYFTANSYYSLFNYEEKNISHYYSNGTSSIEAIDTFYWYPSMENKEKCPSLETPENPCDFDITDYLEIEEVGNDVCFTISSIPTSKFPSSKLPKGFRIYHNFGEQRNIDWNSFQDGLDISFPIEFCIPKCELLDMLSIGRDGIEIAIDFYDEDGNVYNNPGCDSVLINYEFPTFCELFTVDILKIGTEDNCCTYEVALGIDFDLELLDDCPGNPNIEKLIDSLYFITTMDDTPMRLVELDNINIDLSGLITFEYTKCTGDISNISSFKFMISNNGTVCEIDDIDVPFCACDCPDDVDDWVIESTVFEEAPCTDNQCHISAELKIPSMVKDCYINYSIEDGPKLSFPPSGIINFTPPCINKGETKNIQIKLFKTSNDTDPCIIDKSFECPLISTFEECTPDCPNVGWDRRGPILVNLPYPCNSFCKMNVYYSTRTADCSTQVNYDIQVTRMEIINTDPNNPNACNGCTLTDEYLNKIAIREIIWQNEMDFPPAPYGPCELNWRVIQASCWTRIPGIPWGTIENPAPEFILVPCEESSCCTIQIEVCNYGPGGKNIRTIGDVLRDGNGCLNSYFYYHDFNTAQLVSSQCNDVCDEWLNELNEIFYAGGKIVYNDDKNIGIISNEINYYIYNNFDDASIIIELTKNKKVNIQIVDLIGQPILNSKYNLKTGSNKIDYNYLNLQTGIYIINVYSNSKLEISDKFIILR